MSIVFVNGKVSLAYNAVTSSNKQNQEDLRRSLPPEQNYGGPGGRATRRCLRDDDDATIDDDDVTIDDVDTRCG